MIPAGCENYTDDITPAYGTVWKDCATNTLSSDIDFAISGAPTCLLSQSPAIPIGDRHAVDA